VKSSSPLLGFNNNVRHKGRVFHIQTEDSGVKHPHIITHLFADGGRILKTTKTSYAEHIGSEKMAETVRAMMQEQHKAMFVALRDGQFDQLLDMPAATASQSGSTPPGASGTSEGKPPTVTRLTGALQQAAAAAQQQPASTSSPPMSSPLSAPATRAPQTPALKPEVVARSAPPAAIPSPPPPVAATPPPLPRTPSRPPLALSPEALIAQRAAGPTSATPTTRKSTPPPTGHTERSVDLDALERAAEEVQTPFFQQIQDLPPPPATVLAKKPSGAHSSSSSFRAVSPQSVPLPQPESPPQSAMPGGSRYAQSRPAAIFATGRPAEGVSIFGEDLISEKSLDEVILSYLAEDLDSPPEKK
jgi:hypothetical protein